MGDEEATPADEVEPEATTAAQQDSDQQPPAAPGPDGGVQPDSLYHE